MLARPEWNEPHRDPPREPMYPPLDRSTHWKLLTVCVMISIVFLGGVVYPLLEYAHRISVEHELSRMTVSIVK